MECISPSVVFRRVSPSAGKRRWSPWALLCPGRELRIAGSLAITLGAMGAFLEHVRNKDVMGLDKHVHRWLVGFSGFKVFSTMLGFLVVFRNSNAYYNYWNACKLLQQVNGSMYNSFSSCISFSRTSKADAGALAEYQLSIAAYHSLLTAMCYQRLVETDPCISTVTHIPPDFDILGMQVFTEEHLSTLRDSACTPSLVVHWIQACVIEYIDRQVLDLHPALLTRIFDFLHKGFMAYEDLLKFVSYPFPRSYSAAAIWLMMIHALTTPLAVVGVVHHPTNAFLLTFVLVFVFQTMFMQAMSLSNPFQIDEINLNERMRWQNSKFCRVLDAAAGELRGMSHKDEEQLLDHGPLSRIYEEDSSDSECTQLSSHAGTVQRSRESVSRSRTAFLTAARRR